MVAEHPDQDFGRSTAPGDPNPLTERRPIPNRVPTSPPGAQAQQNPREEIDLTRLRDSMQWSEQKIKPFRDRHAACVRYFAGSRYGQRLRGTPDRTPMNMLRLAVDIWSRQLVSQDPRCLVITKAMDLRQSAYELELSTNQLIATMEFGTTLSDMVRSALFTMGVIKVGLTEPYLAESSGFPGAGGQPYAESILMEDWLHDMNARSFKECEWMGNRYRVAYDAVMNNPNFSEDGKAAISKRVAARSNSTMGGGDRKESDISTGRDQTVLQVEYRDRVDLWDIYFPELKKLVTIADDEGVPVLQVRNWKGPQRGPYHILAFSDVPGNLIPSAPAQHLFDMQDILNKVFNQLGRQALRQKTLTIVDGAAEADGTGNRIMDSKDGQIIRTSHIDGVKEFTTRGVDPGNMQFAVWVKELMSYLGGNLDSMGGLSQQGKTLGQEQLLAESSSEMLKDMQQKVLKITKDIMVDISWYMYTNPIATYSLEKDIPGYGTIPFEYGPDDRKNHFFTFNMDVQPFSLQSKTPSDRLSAAMNFIQNILLPFAPNLAEWGINVNMQEMVELVAKYSDLPELTNLISSQQPMLGQTSMQPGMTFGQTAGRRPLQSPTTNRNYTRTNVSTGGTEQQREGELMKALGQAAARQS